MRPTLPSTLCPACGTDDSTRRPYRRPVANFYGHDGGTIAGTYVHFLQLRLLLPPGAAVGDTLGQWTLTEAPTSCTHITFSYPGGRLVRTVCAAHLDCGCCGHVPCAGCGTMHDDDDDVCESCGSVASCCCDCVHCASCAAVIDPDYGTACYTCDCGDCCCECSHCASCGDAHGAYSSNYCGDCGYCYSCGCECGSDECECDACTGEGGSSGLGYSTTAPWVARGAVIDYAAHKAMHPTADHSDCLPVDLTIDPAQAMCDFYLLEAQSSGILTRCGEAHVLRDCPTSRTCTAHMAGARRDFAALVARLAPSFRNYAAAAIGGELRHHNAVGGESHGGDGCYASSSRSGGWRDFHAVMLAVGPAQALRDAAALMREVGGGTFCGEKWAVPCDLLALHHDGALSDALWCDRIFTLMHNGGSFLDKYGWSRDGKYGLRDMMLKIGPAHDSGDFAALTIGASPDVAHGAALCIDRERITLAPAAHGVHCASPAALVHDPATGRLARRIRHGVHAGRVRVLEGD